MIIEVFGNPAPQGSKKYMGRTKAGKGIILEASDNTKPWRADVMTAARRCIEQEVSLNGSFEPFDGAVVARMVFSMRRPSTVKRAKRPFPSVYPDLSKLCRSTEDALKAAGVWRDDALVVEYTRLAKVYCGEDHDALPVPGALIVLGNLIDLVPVEGIPPSPSRRRQRDPVVTEPGSGLPRT